MANDRMKVAEVGRERGDIMLDNVCPSFVGSSLSTAKEKCYQAKGLQSHLLECQGDREGTASWLFTS